MDESTVNALLAFFTACLPFAVGGIIWLEDKLSKKAVEVGMSNKQGDLIFLAAQAVFAFAKEKFKGDPTKAQALAVAEDIMVKMKATWEDPVATNDMMEAYLSQLEVVLKEL